MRRAATATQRMTFRPPTPLNSHAGRRRLALALVAAFLLLGLVNVLAHEMWRDELQAWLIAKESGSLAALLRNLRYDGHPPLWYLLLYAVSRFTADPFAMQLLHLSIAAASVYVFARHSPFTRLQKVLFCFGYFPLYEYAAISRNYAPGILCVFAFCALFRPGLSKNYLPPAFILAALAQCSAYGLMLSLAFALMLFVEAAAVPSSRESLRAGRGDLLAAALIYFASVSLSLLAMLNPEDSGNVVGWSRPKSLEEAGNALSIVWRAFAPVPQLSRQFWNTNVVASWQAAALLSCLVLAAALLMLARARLAALAFGAGTAAILVFVSVKFYGSLRHHGHIFILFVACLWLADSLPRRRPGSRLFDRAAEFFARHARPMFTALLLVHAAAAALACGADWRYPFSQSRNVADFLRDRGMGGVFIVGERDTAVSPVTAYLRREIYYPRGDRMGSFVVFDRKRLSDPQGVPELARRKASERREDVLIISNAPLETGGARGVEKMAEFVGSISPGEEYYLYLVKWPGGTE